MAGTLVQARSTQGTGTAPSLAYSSNPAAGNHLVALLSYFVAGDTFQHLFGNAGDNVFQFASVANGSTRLRAFSLANVIGGATTITAAFNTSVPWGLAIEEWSGHNKFNPVDLSRVITATGTGTTADGGSVTAIAGDTLWGGMTHAASVAVTLSEGAGFTIGTEQEGTTNQPVHTEYKSNVSAGSQSAPHTLGSSQAWAAITAAFNGATLEQAGFRFRNDDGSEAAATWAAAQNANLTEPVGSKRLRILVNATGDVPPEALQLEMQVNGGAYRRVRPG